MKRILIVEDEPIIAEDLSGFLESVGFIISGIAHDARTALSELAKKNQDFAILDIHLGTGSSGLDVADKIHADYSIPYIFLTSFHDDATLEEAKQFSPFGYVVKPFQEKTLITTIEMAFSIHSRIAKPQKSEPEKIVSALNLTDQEKSIAVLLLKGKSYKEIAENLYVSINTVKFHTKNIYLKLDLSSRADFVSRFI